MSRIIRKISGLLLRSHKFVERFNNGRAKVAPYRLNYATVPGTKKIIHINGNFVIGGTSQLIADIVERTSGSYSHQIFVPELPKPIPYQPLTISSFGNDRMRSLYEQLQKERPALVHIHYWVRPMHRYFDFGIWYHNIFKICEDLGLKVLQNINVPTQPFSSPAVVHNVFVSHYVRNEFNSEPTVPSSVIYPGSDLEHFSAPAQHGLPDDTIGMVYRLDRDKLNETSIEVFIRAAKKLSRLTCYIIGGGYYLSHYKKRVKEEGLSRQFVFTGYVSYYDLPGQYKKLGLVVAPVHDESFGQVTPFAMGMGLPVAGYDTGALREILDSSDTLVKYGDIDALADKIIQLNADRNERLELGRRNRERARSEFGIKKMIDDYKALYAKHIE